MRREAADAGFTKGQRARIQILTVQDIFEGKRPDLPKRDEKVPAEERRGHAASGRRATARRRAS